MEVSGFLIHGTILRVDYQNGEHWGVALEKLEEMKYTYGCSVPNHRVATPGGAVFGSYISNYGKTIWFVSTSNPLEYDGMSIGRLVEGGQSAREVQNLLAEEGQSQLDIGLFLLC